MVYSDFTTISSVAEVTPVLWFVRGDINADERVDIADAIALIGYLFSGDDAPTSLAAADANDDGSTDIADAIYLLGFLFRGGSEPPAPFPERGPDPE